MRLVLEAEGRIDAAYGLNNMTRSGFDTSHRCSCNCNIAWTEISLTEREIDVLRQVAAGNANKIIADHLEISEETVKAHMRKILSKLGANDRTHAVAIGIIEI